MWGEGWDCGLWSDDILTRQEWAEENTLLLVVGRSPGEQSMASRVQHQRELATNKRAQAPGLGFRDSIQVMWIEEIVFRDENRDWHE